MCRTDISWRAESRREAGAELRPTDPMTPDSGRAIAVWMAAAEAGPLAQTGGLGDVLSALPPALSRRGLAVRRFLPAYGFIDRSGFAYEDLNLGVRLGPAR